MGTDDFNPNQWQTLSLCLSVPQAFQDAMGAHLKHTNMPSRSEALGLAASAHALNRPSTHMELLLEEVLHNT